MIIVDGDQGTGEWMEIRAGIPTASCFDQILTPNTLKLSKSASGYAKELVAARLWGVYEDSYQSVHMSNGISREAEARSAYEAETAQEVRQVRFVYKDEKMDRGCSPDGLIGDNGVTEIKSPKLRTHMHYVMSGAGPEDYKCQIQGELYVCEREYCDFVSYFPGAPLHIQRVNREETFIKRLADAIDQFNAELDALTERLKGK